MTYWVLVGVYVMVAVAIMLIYRGPERPRVDYKKIERLEIELGIVEAPPPPRYMADFQDVTGKTEILHSPRGYRHPGYGRPSAAITRAMTDEDWRIAAKRYAKQAHRREMRDPYGTNIVLKKRIW